jgi:hypothetical protein
MSQPISFDREILLAKPSTYSEGGGRIFYVWMNEKMKLHRDSGLPSRIEIDASTDLITRMEFTVNGVPKRDGGDATHLYYMDGKISGKEWRGSSLSRKSRIEKGLPTMMYLDDDLIICEFADLTSVIYSATNIPAEYMWF